MNSFRVVEQFEQSVARFSGAPFAVAVNSCTTALFLCMKYAQTCIKYAGPLRIPARTFVSVPMAAVHAGYKVEFEDRAWDGVYTIKPLSIVDSALRFRRGMYEGGLHCLSFHARKLLNIGEGGMILTGNKDAAEWLRKARYSGRDMENGYRVEDIAMIGWQAYMSPEKAARGLHLMDYIADDLPDQVVEYPDLREVMAFKAVVHA